MWNQLRNAFVAGYGLWGTFGIFLGALSVFNLIVKAFDLGILPVMQDLLATYRWTFHTVLLAPLWSLFKYDAPDWLNDAVVIWIACAAISYRTLCAARKYSAFYWNSKYLGDVEKGLFELPTWKFILVAGLASLFAWPFLWARYAYSATFTFQLPGAHEMSFGAQFDLGRSNINYRTVWLVQLTSIATLVALLLITSAGLPAT